MASLIVKFIVSGLLIVAASELGKRSTLVGALTVSLPLTSIIALCWLYAETGDRAKVGAMTSEILWLVIPSLVLFLILPPLLRRGMNFALAMSISCAATALAYWGTIFVLQAVRSPSP